MSWALVKHPGQHVKVILVPVDGGNVYTFNLAIALFLPALIYLK